MNKKSIKTRPRRGRPGAPIDWAVVDRLLEADCEGTEIAAYLGIHPNTLYMRCEKEKLCNFSEYLYKNKSRGNSLIKVKQHKLAMDGDKVMLIWLGKNRLGQRDKHAHDITVKNYRVSLPDGD